MNGKNLVLWILVGFFSLGILGLLYGIFKHPSGIPKPSLPLAFEGIDATALVQSTLPPPSSPPPSRSIESAAVENVSSIPAPDPTSSFSISQISQSRRKSNSKAGSKTGSKAGSKRSAKK